MLKNYLKITFRNFKRSKIFSFINITGLSLGIALVVYILLFIDFHLGFDRFHKDVDRIFKVGVMTKSNESTQWAGANMSPMGGVIRNNYPQIEEVARMANPFEPTIRYAEKVFKGHQAIYAESEFFKIMTLPIIDGNKSTPLDRKNTMIITRKLAGKLFGDESALGKFVQIDNEEYEITAVLEDYPANTDFDLDIYCSWKNIENTRWFGWQLLARATLTYVKLREDVNSEGFEKLIEDIPSEYCAEEMKQKGMMAKNFLIPFKDNHLYSWSSGTKEEVKSMKYVYILSGVGLFVLLLACINFMNLSTARSTLRATEIGLRKVVGANKTQLIKQFLGESMIMAFVSAVLSIAFLYLFIPYLNELTNVSITTSDVWRPGVIWGFLSVIIITGLISGLYPAFYLSKFLPETVFKGVESSEKGGMFFRRVFVIGQFAITITLIIVTIVMFSQVGYMKNRNLGFEKKQKVIIKLNTWRMITDNYTSVKDEFLEYPDITKITCASGVPGVFVNRLYIEADVNLVRTGVAPRCLRCDYDFVNVLGIKMLAGRFFKKERVSDPNASGVVINNKAAKLFGFASPLDAINKTIYIGGDTPTEIIGVTDDFHWVGLQTEIEPLVMRYVPELFRYLTLQLDTERVHDTMEFIETKYAKLFPGEVFEYMFVDENFDKLYRQEDRLISLFTTISLLGILIACLGLFGLTVFVAERKIKEIGIRKVLGASIGSVIIMLTKEFARWVIVANIIAWPIAYYAMNYWLQDFAYRTSLNIWHFLSGGLIALAVALITISIQSYKASVANPVDAIKYE